jgi:phenylacetate-coenzyme A ligase PaaK-like adenylate-forming protein
LAGLYLDVDNLLLAEDQIKKIEELSKLPLITSENVVQNYYETFVTGRGNKNISSYLQTLKKELQEAKQQK